MKFPSVLLSRLINRIQVVWKSRRSTKTTLIPRENYQYRIFSMDGVPKRHRASALATRLTGWQAEHSARYLVAQVTDWVMVVASPVGQESGGLIASGYPEGIVAPDNDGHVVRLLVCGHGFEGQYWESGVLQATRWWPVIPTEVDWQNFQRGGGIPVAQRIAIVPEVTLLDDASVRRFKFFALEEVLEAPKRREHLRLAAVSFFLMLFSLWVVLEGLALSEQTGKLKDDIAKREAVAGKAASLREEALRNVDQIRAIQAQGATVSVLAVMAHLVQVLPSDGYVVRELEVKDGGVRVAFSPGGRNKLSDYVAALERAGWWTEMTANTLPGSLFEVTAKVTGSPVAKSRQPADAPADAASKPMTKGADQKLSALGGSRAG